jgi:outer membrane protein insertion porin family
MSRIALIVPIAVAGALAADPDPNLIRSVVISGATTQYNFATRAGEPYDTNCVTRDVRALWSTGRFEDIRVETSDGPEGKDVTFQVVEKPPLVLHQIRIEPHSFGIQFTLPEGTPMDRFRAQQVAGQVRKRLSENGYTDADVEPEIVPYMGKKVDLHLLVHAGDPVRVREVSIGGETGLDSKEVERELHAIRIRRILPGWHMYPAYSENAVQSDLGRLRSFYLSKGYFDAKVRLDKTDVKGTDASVYISVDSGPAYRVNQWEVSAPGIETMLVKPPDGVFRVDSFCACLYRARKYAEQRGILDFNPRLAVQRDSSGAADLSATVEEGRRYTVGRIEFIGRKNFSEEAVRRNFVLDESEPLDEGLLRKSLARLNRANYFERVDDTNVQIHPNTETGVADITIQLHERKNGFWNLSGPVGPFSLSGPLQASIGSRLPPWGRGLLEMSTYYASFSLLGYSQGLAALGMATKGPLLAVIALRRPYSPGEGWKSGFLIAPQLGWQASAISYVTTQLTSRLTPLLLGDYQMTPALPVTVMGPTGDSQMLCNPPKPRLYRLRSVTSMILQTAGAASAF